MGKDKTYRVTKAHKSVKFQTKLAIVFSILAVSVSSLLVFTLYLHFRTKLRSDLRDRLRDMVGIAALNLDGEVADAHATLTDPNQEGNPTYVRIKGLLQQIHERATDTRFAYTWRRGPEGRLTFVVDAETDPNEISHLGDVYDSGDASVLAKLATLDGVMTDDEPTGDKWGVWLSGYAPFYGSDGHMEGILGLDVSAAIVLAHERQFLWVGLAVLAATVPLVLALGFWFGRNLAAPIVELTRGTERIAQGDLSHRVSVKGQDETHLLAQSFNEMTDTLREAIVHRDTEISSRKKAESALQVLNIDLEANVQRLSRANEELRKFAFATSHDLKTPLRGIRVLADWIATDYMDKLDEKGAQYLDLLVKRTTRMYNLVEAIHQYTSIGYQESRVTVDLNELVPQVVSRLAPPENVRITIEGSLPPVQYDKDRISQIFVYLLENAIEYMDKPQGRIVVRGVEEATCWKLSVTDNGPGIEPKYHQKVFEIFQTLATKDESENTGMGLSIVRKIVESYGGKIWIESLVGEGTTFFFTLPKQTPAPAEPQPLAAEPVGSPGY
jgi:signal transduction histidine kinase